MKLSSFKSALPNLDTVNFKLPDGTPVPAHFHVTEVGLVTKHFIDCGGKIRDEQKVNLQLLDANDFDHRLKPGKLLNIIRLSEQKLNIPDAEIEVEYQNETIGKYGLDFDGKDFILTNQQTACLAKDNCGIPAEKNSSTAAAICCTPGGGCC